MLKIVLSKLDLRAIATVNTLPALKRFPETLSFSDGLTVNLQTLFSDSISQSDSAVLGFSLGLSDSVSVSDVLAFEIELAALETITTNDLFPFAFSFSNAEGDALGISDVCLTFVSSNSDGATFNEAEINSFAFNG